MLRRALLAALLLACAPGAARADTVHLTDGRKLQGEATWSADGKRLVIRTRFGSVTVDRADVLRLEEEETNEQQLARRRAALAPDDHAGRVTLAEWCLDNALERDAAALLLEVLAAEPEGEARDGLDDEGLAPFRSAAGLLGARLDYHLEDGRWLAPEEYYPAKGFVRHRGRWVPRALVDLIDQLAAAEEDAKQRRVEERRAERAVRPALEAATEAQAKRAKLARTLANIAGEKQVAARDLHAKEADRRAAEERLAHARRALEVFLVAGNDGSERARAALDALQTDVARHDGDAARARRLEDEARARLDELTRLEAQGPTVTAEAEARVAAARQAASDAERALAGSREAVAAAAARIADLERQLEDMKRGR